MDFYGTGCSRIQHAKGATVRHAGVTFIHLRKPLDHTIKSPHRMILNGIKSGLANCDGACLVITDGDATESAVMQFIQDNPNCVVIEVSSTGVFQTKSLMNQKLQ